MPPASKSKSKEKKAGKDAQKASSKPNAPASTGSSVQCSAYNPGSGTFHSLDATSASIAPGSQANVRFRNTDEVEDHSGVSYGASGDYDSTSNNGSWSGESEDHKEKIPTIPARQDALPGADNDKREKIRQKNERKHQRQKERRAQELHERCCVYIMSRKLDSRVQQLVSMGFSHERSTAALMLNEGKLEESIAWLFEGGEDADRNGGGSSGGGNLKIDIAEELTRISDMEAKFKCSKQEVERAIVTSEGDLDRAARSLSNLKLEDYGDPPTSTPSRSVGRELQNQLPSSAQGKKEDKDFNYTKAAVPSHPPPEPSGKIVQPLPKKMPPKFDWAKPQQAERRWPPMAPNSVSSFQASPVPVRAEVPSANDYRIPNPTVLARPRPQPVNSKHIMGPSIGTSSSGTAGNWFPSTSTSINSNQMLPPVQYQQPQMFNNLPDSINKGDGLSRSRFGTAPTLTPAASLGLFAGTGSSGTSFDWSSNGTTAQYDYSSIDWSLNPGLLSPTPNDLWAGPDTLTGTDMSTATRTTASSRVPVSGLPEGGLPVSETVAPSSREWTSAFEGNDLLSLPRKYVSSASL